MVKKKLLINSQFFLQHAHAIMASTDAGGVNELAKILVPSAPRVVADVAVDVLGG